MRRYNCKEPVIECRVLMAYPRKSPEETVVIQDGVVEIAEDAFYGCQNIKKLILPESVKVIGDYAFSCCTSLREIYIYGTIESFGYDVFYYDNEIKEIIAPSVPFDCFYNALLRRAACLGFLRNWEKYGEEENIADYREYIQSQKKKILPEIFKSDCAKALEFLSESGMITKRNVDESFLNPAMEAKAASCISFILEWKSRNISEKDMEKILEHELLKDPYNSTDMGKIWSWEKISDNEIRITSYKGNEKDISVPARIGKNNVSEIGDAVFFPRKKGRVYERCCFLNTINSVTFEGKIKYIGVIAFAHCSNLTSVYFSDGVEKIGDWAFYGCGNLNSINIPEKNTEIGFAAFNCCKSLTDNDGFTIVNGTLYGYYGTESTIVIPDRVENLGYESLEMKGQDYIFPKSFVHMETSAFKYDFTDKSERTKYSSICVPNAYPLLCGDQDAAARGFILHQELYKNEYIASSYKDYIVKNWQSFIKFIRRKDAVDFIALFAEKGIMNEENYEKVFLKPSINARAVKCTKYIRQWAKNR